MMNSSPLSNRLKQISLSILPSKSSNKLPMAPLPQKLDDSGGAPNLSRRKSNENVGFVAPHPVVQLLLRRILNSLGICRFLPRGWSFIFKKK